MNIHRAIAAGVLAGLAGLASASHAQDPGGPSPDYCVAVYHVDWENAPPGEATKAAARKGEEFYPFAEAAMGGDDAFDQDFSDMLREMDEEAEAGRFDIRAAVDRCDAKWGSAEAREAAIASGAYRVATPGGSRQASAAQEPSYAATPPSGDSECAKLDREATSMMNSYTDKLADLAASDEDDALDRARDAYDGFASRLENVLILTNHYDCTQLSSDIRQVLRELPRP